jgi:chromosome partitioning protein
MMRTIVLATQKGGSGKSTLAVGLAVAAIEDGHVVGMVETDQQGTISNWGRRRALPQPLIETAASDSEIQRVLLGFGHAGITLAVVDTPATSNDLSASAIAAADLCLIPTRPSQADIEAAVPTLRTIRKLGKPFAFVLNQTPSRGYRTDEAALALNSAGLLALPYIIQRNDHQDALGKGLAVTEHAPDGKAAQEIRGLWQWVSQAIAVEVVDRGNAPIRATG